MRRNDIRELKSKTENELARTLVDLKAELAKIKTSEYTNKSKNTNLVRNKKKDIARVLTILSIKKKE